MKILSILSAAVLTAVLAVPSRAQVFRPETVGGAVLGGLAGAVIGHNDGRNGWEGAAYGAAAGALLGTVVGHARDSRDYGHTQVHRPGYGYGRHGIIRSPRWGHGGFHDHHRYAGLWGHHRDPWSRPVWYSRSYYPAYSRPVYVSRDGYRPSYAGSGALLGGIAGAIIGHNNGRNAWEGAAYGLGGGYLLGSWADARARREVAESAQSVVPVLQSAPAAAPAQVTIINNYYQAPATPMSGANSLFGR